ncbi:acetylneuraminic acid synthetase [Clostridium botulinum]|uniref:N-acetylneuraminate synthase family protein n=1 Tax=Clostridium botulinum TaxID=1491 RepID=UPI000A1766D9|nr:N-acetylneuraminate synthase family protein [Clostridium botulinum]AUN11672.1 acetylneuraminic acid synthetase [Clostridium botulinum]AUN22615.1 acetylneuraminic acid synthetase [Clostridium botulinum]AUN26325.1 acetylneuraminic acid synthetase [Clostridium botulinum]OSA71689.1 acetylneuraminic acid synthetase [Clostridium botulinum]QDY22092.1 acetylneuraminic acid synthetase [Clostridium botulinum]
MEGIMESIKNSKDAFIIAEIGVNYYDIAKKESITALEAAKLMIKEAKNAGAQAAKFQTYKAGKIASKKAPAYWDTTEENTKSQYELFTKFDKFGESEYVELAKYCEEIGIMFMSTPFDFESADYLNDLMAIYKISSSDLTNLPFIQHIAKKGKPVFISTGAATIGEIEDAINTILSTGNKEMCIMHCVLDYPTKYENANLNMIKHLKEVFPGYMLGYSDHTKPDKNMLVLTKAYEYGAKVIEKHFTLDKTLIGNDHYHAMDPSDLETFKHNLYMLDLIEGEYCKRPLECENSSRKQARRSLIAKQEIKKGEVVTKDMITFKRPGTGISPIDLDRILGRQAKVNIEEDTILTWELF